MPSARAAVVAVHGDRGTRIGHGLADRDRILGLEEPVELAAPVRETAEVRNIGPIGLRVSG